MKAILFYFQFFTQIPINIEIPHADKVYRDGIALMGLFGGIYTLILSIIYIALYRFVGIELAWVLVLFADALLTGGFHQDALADTVDGVFSSRTKVEILRIMKDSRVGSNGVLALIFYYLIMYVAGTQLMYTQLTMMGSMTLLFMIGFTSRSLLAWAHHHYQYVSHTPNGLGSMVVGISFQKILIGQIIALLVSSIIYSWQGLVAYLITWAVVECYRRAIIAFLGGMNGDTTGTVCIIATMTYIVSLLIVW